MKTTGQKIKERREEIGMSQQELANRVGLKTKSAISLIENNKRGIEKDLLVKFADALVCPVDYLVEQKRTGLTVRFKPSTAHALVEKSEKALLDDYKTKMNRYLDRFINMSEEDQIIDDYISDPDIRRLVLFAGENLPKENRALFVDALIGTIKALNGAKK